MTTPRRQSGQEHRDSRRPKPTSSARRTGKSPNEGEGSRSAARDYNQRTARFVESGRVNESAEAVERAVNSGEREKLEEAERIGREHRKS